MSFLRGKRESQPLRGKEKKQEKEAEAEIKKLKKMIDEALEYVNPVLDDINAEKVSDHLNKINKQCEIILKSINSMSDEQVERLGPIIKDVGVFVEICHPTDRDPETKQHTRHIHNGRDIEGITGQNISILCATLYNALYGEESKTTPNKIPPSHFFEVVHKGLSDKVTTLKERTQTARPAP